MPIMNCKRCGAVLNASAPWCSCGEPIPESVATRRAGVTKGLLLAKLIPNINQSRMVSVAIIIIEAAFFTLTSPSGSMILMAAGAFGVIFGIVTLFVPSIIVGEVGVYQNGLERKIRRGRSRERMFLPWSGIKEHHWDGAVLHFTWSPNAFLSFTGDQIESSQPFEGTIKPGIGSDFDRGSTSNGFPVKLEVPEGKLQIVRGLLP